ncbi:hypothetical protein ACFOFO_25615 [Undibacterium arcticum]|uniref:Uncharacterized protein n=1 Tax=Undibacterium arcticum TaxID=1762892 RepID=A0ABV7FC24_9BURK
MKGFSPFKNETEALQIDDLKIENRVDQVAIYGSTQITKDQSGLAIALELKALLDAIVAELQSGPLPRQIEIVPTDTVANPFAKK